MVAKIAVFGVLWTRAGAWVAHNQVVKIFAYFEAKFAAEISMPFSVLKSCFSLPFLPAFGIFVTPR